MDTTGDRRRRRRLALWLGWSATILGVAAAGLLIVMALSLSSATRPSSCRVATCPSPLATHVRTASVAAPILSTGGVLLGVLGAGGLAVATLTHKRSLKHRKG